MKFDRTRNSAELRELLDCLFCIAIGCMVAALVGMSWLVASAMVLYAFKHRPKKGAVLSPQLRAFAFVICFGLLLIENWGDYKRGVADGYEAAASATSGATHNPAHPTLKNSPLSRG